MTAREQDMSQPFCRNCSKIFTECSLDRWQAPSANEKQPTWENTHFEEFGGQADITAGSREECYICHMIVERQTLKARRNMFVSQRWDYLHSFARYVLNTREGFPEQFSLDLSNAGGTEHTAQFLLLRHAAVSDTTSSSGIHSSNLHWQPPRPETGTIMAFGLHREPPEM